eukprot:3096745-Amphidinium_carterae.4
MDWLDEAVEELTSSKESSGYRKPEDQTCNTPLTREVLQELVAAARGTDTARSWLKSHAAVFSGHSSSLQVDDGRIHSRMISTDLLEGIPIDGAYSSVVGAEELGLTAGLEVLRAFSIGTRRTTGAGLLLDPVDVALDRVDPKAVMGASSQYRARSLAVTTIIDSMDCLQWRPSAKIADSHVVRVHSRGLRAIAATNRFACFWVDNDCGTSCTGVVFDRATLLMVRDTLLLRSCALQMSEVSKQMHSTDLPSPELIQEKS